MADVQRDPELLRAHACEADELAAILAAALDERGEPATAELDGVTAVVRRAVGELVDLGTVLRAAARIEDADSAAQRALHRVLRP